MNMMGEGFEAPNGASALKTHSSNLNRSVTASHMALPTSARKFRTYLHRLKPESFFFFPSSYQIFVGAGCALSSKSPRTQQLRDGAARKPFQREVCREGWAEQIPLRALALGPSEACRRPGRPPAGEPALLQVRQHGERWLLCHR